MMKSSVFRKCWRCTVQCFFISQQFLLLISIVLRLLLFQYIIGFTECVRLSQSVLGTHLTYLTPIHVTLLLIHVYKMTLKRIISKLWTYIRRLFNALKAAVLMIYIYNDLINAKIFTDVLDVLAYAHYYKVYLIKAGSIKQ